MKGKPEAEGREREIPAPKADPGMQRDRRSRHGRGPARGHPARSTTSIPASTTSISTHRRRACARSASAGSTPPRAASRIAARERSMSSSVVDQLTIEMRIAAMPCHVVPDSQHVPSAWTREIDLPSPGIRVAAVGRVEPREDLVEDDIVEDLDPASRAAPRPCASPAGSSAPPSRGRRPGPATGAPRRPGTHAPGGNTPGPSGTRHVPPTRRRCTPRPAATALRRGRSDRARTRSRSRRAR